MLITIGVPLYNAADDLLDCIRSIQLQTEERWELLLVDDGSTDNTVEIAKSIRDTRVRVISDGVNRGLPARLNQIAQLAQGKYIARQDGDDLMHPKRLEEQLRVLEQDPSVDAVGCPWYAIDCESRVVGQGSREAPDMSPEGVLRRVPLSHGTVLGRRDWWRKIPYDESLRRSQDRDFWIRAILEQSSSVAMLSAPRYYYRIPQAISLEKTLEGYRNNRRIYRQYAWRSVGARKTLFWIAESRLKSIAWALASRTPMSKRLSRSRSLELSSSELEGAQRTLDEIRTASVAITASTEAA